MRKYFLILTLTLIFACSNDSTSKQNNSITISGKMHSQDGTDFEMSNARLIYFGQNELDTSVDAGPKGEFSFSLEGTGLARIYFTAPYHKPNFVEVIIDENSKDIDLDISMSAYTPDPSNEQYVVIGSFNNFNFNSGIMLTKQSEGVYSGMLPNDSDTLTYQVLGVVNYPVPRSVNGTQYDFLVPDETGDYRSAIVSDKNTINLTLDLSKYASEEKEFEVKASDPTVSDYFAALKDQDMIFGQMDRNIRAIFPPSTPDQEEMISGYVKETLEQYATKFNSSKGSIKSSYGIKYLETVAYTQMIGGFELADKELISSVFTNVNATNPLWMKSTFSILPTLGLIQENALQSEEFQKILNNNPLESVRLELLYFALEYAHQNKQLDLAGSFYNQLQNEFPNSQQAQVAQKNFNPNRKVIPGKLIPEFNLESVDSDEKFTRESFKGKYVLYDIWATWCGPCVREMPNLHKAYEKFKDKNFTIFSLSIDKNKEDIGKFRNGQWKMPWAHTFMPGVWESKLTEIFEVTSVPRPILVGPDGKIISTSPQELRGEELIKTIERYLGE